MKIFVAPSLSLALTLTALFWAGATLAATNDIYPGDYYPSDPGDKIVSFYLYDRTSVGPYAKGSKQTNGNLTGQIAAIRGVNTFELAGMTATSVVALTWADLDAKPLTLANAIGANTTGFGDLRLGLTPPSTCTWVASSTGVARPASTGSARTTRQRTTAPLSAPPGSYPTGNR